MNSLTEKRKCVICQQRLVMSKGFDDCPNAPQQKPENRNGTCIYPAS